jgi:ribosomal protein L11 methylase PrmA
MSKTPLSSSFRDPGGYLFEQEGKLFRQVNKASEQDYELLMSSGLYATLTKKKWLIPHKEIEGQQSPECHKILQPVRVPYISYPYEWSFSQLKDAALLTLDIQTTALAHGLSLKDASAYNIQFFEGRPVFIDTLSFEPYQEGSAWVAYRQFCQHFLAPLALICHVDYRQLRLSQVFIDGIPLDLASRLLPRRTWLKYSLLAHIHLHAKTQQKYEDIGRNQASGTTVEMSALRLEGLLASLKNGVNALSWTHQITEWGDYYGDTNYVDESMKNKEALVTQFLESCRKSDLPTAADFGANTGKFSRLAAAQGFFVLAHDIDAVAVDKNYREVKSNAETSILPLVQDLTSPSPAIGWANRERMSFVERHRVDVGLALAIIHHIHISNNVPMAMIAEFFSTICESLILEFVPKSDSQVIRLLSTREDIFSDYNEAGFEAAFGQYFTIQTSQKIVGSERTLYLLEKKHG